MRKRFYLVAALASSLFLVSCSKDDPKPTTETTNPPATTTTNPDNNTGNTQNPGTTENPTTATPPLNPETSKTKLEASGQEMQSIISGAENGKAVKALASLVKLTGTDKMLGSTSLPAMTVINNTSNISSSSSLKSFKEGQETQNDMQAVMDSVEGTYTWNSISKKFEKTVTDGKFILKFPSVEGSTQNDAEFVFSDLTSIVNTTKNSALLTGCKARLSIQGSDVMTYSFEAAYNAKFIPTKIATRLTVDDFSLNYSFVYSSSILSSDYSIKHLDKILFAEGFEINGNITEEKAAELTKYYSDTTVQKKEMTKVSEFVSKATVYYQFMDAKVIGSVDAVTLTKSVDQAITNKTTDVASGVSIINNSVSLYAIFASTNERIAKAELYLKNETDKEPSVRLIFADETKTDFESYFGDAGNIKDLINELAVKGQSYIN